MLLQLCCCNGEGVEVLLTLGAEVAQGHRLCPTVLVLEVGRSRLVLWLGSQVRELLGLWRGALGLGLELQVNCRGRGALGL